MDPSKISHYLADDPPTVVPLAIKPHFEALNDQEKAYAHYISVACFAGTRIVLRQVSEESEAIYDLILELHSSSKGDWKALQKIAGITGEDLTHFLNYAAQFLGNGGNFKSFGDSKIVPRIGLAQLKTLASTSDRALKLFEKVKDKLYAAADEEHMLLGYPDKHVSSYYPDTQISESEIKAVDAVLSNKKFLPENTRLRKAADGNFELLIASAEHSPADRDSTETSFDLGGDYEGKHVKLVYGDHSTEMGKIATALKEAEKHASNSVEAQMMTEYAKAFNTGSMKAYKDSQRSWIKDKGPMVETDIGFVETYRDPQGIRGEWEGFAAMVNKERTRAFSKLVESAPANILKLPWGKDFEKDTFLAPDFTSLEVLTFAGSGIPAGINIPNFDDIRQNEGFKNVSLGNVLSAKAPNEKIPFVRDSDIEPFRKYRDAAFEVQVGLHELLGHGCGKLQQETSPGQYNFDIKSPPINPLTDKPIDCWYKPGETWNSVFGNPGASYEECRAECVAMALSCDFEILKIFGIGDGSVDIHGEAGDVLFVSYLQMARAGVLALEFWDPKSGKWGQAHMQARFSILRTFLDAGDNFCILDHSADDLSDLTIKLDREKILSHGRPAVEKYLQKLQVYKSTADVKKGLGMYNDITSVNKFFAEKVRPAVLKKKVPRKVYVQANTFIENGKVVLKEYDATPEGMIQSYAERTYV